MAILAFLRVLRVHAFMRLITTNLRLRAAPFQTAADSIPAFSSNFG